MWNEENGPLVYIHVDQGVDLGVGMTSRRVYVLPRLEGSK